MATINTIPLNKYWADDAFPFELLPRFKKLQLGGSGFENFGCAASVLSLDISSVLNSGMFRK